MNKLLAAASVFAVMTSAAMAADLPSRKYAPVAPVVVAPVFTWTGFYAGVNAGYAWGEGTDLPDVNSTVITGFSRAGQGFGNIVKTEDGSFTGGGQIGYNYQVGQFVIGAEADINYADIKRGVTATSDRFGLYTDALSAKSTVEWFGTVRARVGVVPTERLLVFVTGGFAYGSVKKSIGINDYTYGGQWFAGINGSKTETRTGWTIGGGAEYAVTDNVTVKAEYAYVDLGNKTHVAYDNNVSYPGAGLFVTGRDQAKFHVVRAGLNYKF